LTADEVKVIASGIMQVTILDKSRSLNGNNINFWVKIKAVVTTDKIEDMAQKAKDNSIAEDYAKLQQDYAKSQAEISSLKQQLAAANTDSDKVRIRTQITASESTFQANGYFEQGNQFMLAHDYYNAVQSFSAAINMNSHFGRAYLRRGMAHVRLADYQAALNDFNTALEINPRLSLAYFGEGLVYEKAHDRQAAIAAFHRFLENSPPEQQPYINYTLRQLHYLERGEMAP
jgi:tetratricopeptide (TPR) repeat protein